MNSLFRRYSFSRDLVVFVLLSLTALGLIFLGNDQSQNGAVQAPGRGPRQPINWRPLKWLLWLLLLVLLAGLIYQEMRSSVLQARVWHYLAQQLTFSTEAGPAPQEAAPVYPQGGPFDLRAGYSQLPAWLTTLNEQGFQRISNNS